MKTTLNKIREHLPCTSGWEKLLRLLNKKKADDEPISIVQIIDSNGLDDALWCLRAVEGRDREIRQYMVWCARQVQHLMTDPRSLNALYIAERFANGLATQEELAAARDAAGDAAWDAGSARDAAGAAAWAAKAARDAAGDAALDAARAAGSAAWDAAMAAARAAGSARDAAGAAAWAAKAAWDAAGDVAWSAGDAAWAAVMAAVRADTGSDVDAAWAARSAAKNAAMDAKEKKLRDLCAWCDQNPVLARIGKKK